MSPLRLAEAANGALAPAPASALTAAKQLGADVHVLAAGPDANAAAEPAAKLRCGSGGWCGL